MFLGMDLPALDLPDPWDTYTMIGFVAWHVGTDVLLEIHSYCLIRKGTSPTGLIFTLLAKDLSELNFKSFFFFFSF